MSLKQFYFSFNGRINRSAFWLKGLIVLCLLQGIVLFMMSRIVDIVGVGIASVISLLFLWMNLAVIAKRWHDRNKSGWWSLIGIVPIIGGIWVLIECGFLKGTGGANRFGPDPLQGGQAS